MRKPCLVSMCIWMERETNMQALPAPLTAGICAHLPAKITALQIVFGHLHSVVIPALTEEMLSLWK